MSLTSTSGRSLGDHHCRSQAISSFLWHQPSAPRNSDGVTTCSTHRGMSMPGWIQGCRNDDDWFRLPAADEWSAQLQTAVLSSTPLLPPPCTLAMYNFARGIRDSLQHTNTTPKFKHRGVEPGYFAMATTKLPAIETVPDLPTDDRAAILDLLFEPSKQLHSLSVPLLHEKSFESYGDLIAAVGVQLTDLSESASSSDTEWLESILGSHPRLGAKKVESTQSQAEQSQLQGNAEEAEQLRALNEEYEMKYPGLRYVVFVNGRSRPVIMEDMRNRIANGDLKSERAAAIRAMCEIAADRASKLA